MEQEQEATQKSEQELFDEYCQKLYDLKKKSESIKDQVKQVDRIKKELESKIRDLLDKNISGKNWDAEDAVARRRVGNIAEPELRELRKFHPRFVRMDPGNLKVVTHNPFELDMFEDVMKKNDIPYDRMDPEMKAETLGIVEKVISENPHLERNRTEIMELLQIKYTKEIKVMPSILNAAVE